MTRSEARENMMIIAYQLDIRNEFSIDYSDSYFSKIPDPTDQEKYMKELFSLLCNKREEVDRLIQHYSPKWDIHRMSKPDLAVLRIACCEILYFDDIPDQVAANEAVELSKKYGEANSYSYVNGILGQVIRNEKHG
jgi:N utilization substance protein B